ncbi:UNVERIFIED_CONTAM: hypothetical protein Sindi_3002500 [Sesamum indicum]
MIAIVGLFTLLMCRIIATIPLFGIAYVGSGDVAEPLIFWTLGQGAVSFWHDNWFGEKPLAQLVRGAPDTMEPRDRGTELCGPRRVMDVFHSIGMGGHSSGVSSAATLYRYMAPILEANGCRSFCGGFSRIGSQWMNA